MAHTSKKQALACQSAMAGVNPSNFSKAPWSVVLLIIDAERILATVNWSQNKNNLKTCNIILHDTISLTCSHIFFCYIETVQKLFKFHTPLVCTLVSSTSKNSSSTSSHNLLVAFLAGTYWSRLSSIWHISVIFASL